MRTFSSAPGGSPSAFRGLDDRLDEGRVEFRPRTPSGFTRRGPKNYQRSDERIGEEIYEWLVRDRTIHSQEVTLRVSGGEVTFEGTVPERWMKHAIEDLATEIAGVREVHNRIRVRRE
jgi:osmotically-inducible protein OsmY